MAAVALAAVLAFSSPATAQEAETEAEIQVAFTEDAMGFNVTAESEITAVLVELCDGTELDLEVEAGSTAFNNTSDQVIASVLVTANATVRFDSEACPPEETETTTGTTTETTTAPPCAPVVTALALEGPMNQLTWTAVADVDGYNVHRAEGDGEFELVATVEGTQYTDEDVTAGTTYRYQVVAVVDGEEVDGCAEVELTTIPVLPTLFAGLMAGILGIVAYAAVRRRL